MPLCKEVGLSPVDFVLYMGTQPPPQKGRSPQFSAHVYCGQTAAWIKMPLGTEVGLGLALPPVNGHRPHLSANNVRCGQTAGWTKMTLGVEVGLGLGDFVFDGDPETPRKKAPHPIFGLYLLWSYGWVGEDATGYGSRPRPRRHCIRWDGVPALHERGTAALPLFSAHVYCGHGRPSQLLLSSCVTYNN